MGAGRGIGAPSSFAALADMVVGNGVDPGMEGSDLLDAASGLWCGGVYACRAWKDCVLALDGGDEGR